MGWADLSETVDIKEVLLCVQACLGMGMYDQNLI